MGDVGKALEGCADAVFNQAALNEDDRPALARAAIMAFLRAMPDFEERPDPRGIMQLPNFPSALAAAIEKETAP